LEIFREIFLKKKVFFEKKNETFRKKRKFREHFSGQGCIIFQTKSAKKFQLKAGINGVMKNGVAGALKNVNVREHVVLIITIK
jgi:hypothetical protein